MTGDRLLVLLTKLFLQIANKLVVFCPLCLKTLCGAQPFVENHDPPDWKHTVQFTALKSVGSIFSTEVVDHKTFIICCFSPLIKLQS